MFRVEHLDVGLLLEEWRWLCSESVTILARNVFGDLFLRTSDGKVLWLNVTGGTVSEIAENESSFWHLLEEPVKRVEWLALEDEDAAAHRGLCLNDEQCIGFKIPVIFAESATIPDNTYIASLYEQVSFLGDLHRQLSMSPDGTKVRLQL